MTERTGLVIVGGGAAGLMAAIAAGRGGQPSMVLDGARTLGAKILVSGGGRCNLTHDEVDERDYAGSTPPAIRNVLRRFTVADTLAFFSALDVELKREETGKLFPITDSARTVLDALLQAAADAGGEVRHPCRVDRIERVGDCYRVGGQFGAIEAQRVILATGGQSLPKSGSDGGGYVLARSLGHTRTAHLLPALVGLTLEPGSLPRQVSGLSLDATIEVRAGSGKRLHALTGSTLCTHFGLSGPAAMDISRHWQHARLADPGVHLVVSWLPGETPEGLDAALRALGPETPRRYLSRRMPARLAEALCTEAGLDEAVTGHTLSRELRQALRRRVLAWPAPVTGTRGWNHAEATAGGVPLSEVRLETLESRVAPGVYLCGELLDVDGRIGGYNFQWAWASGHVAGTAAARAARSTPAPII